ncbi:hypothetical protein, partial [Klebsiella variicola]|uniref:hypothetical protein n=1 Tax=Klebsiella variicola TaxID=244366 RepID=UPI001A7E96A5
DDCNLADVRDGPGRAGGGWSRIGHDDGPVTIVIFNLSRRAEQIPGKSPRKLIVTSWNDERP